MVTRMVTPTWNRCVAMPCDAHQRGDKQDKCLISEDGINVSPNEIVLPLEGQGGTGANDGANENLISTTETESQSKEANQRWIVSHSINGFTL